MDQTTLAMIATLATAIGGLATYIAKHHRDQVKNLQQKLKDSEAKCDKLVEERISELQTNFRRGLEFTSKTRSLAGGRALSKEEAEVIAATEVKQQALSKDALKALLEKRVQEIWTEANNTLEQEKTKRTGRW